MAPYDQISHLTLLSKFKKGKRWYWKCVCICGKLLERRADFFKNGENVSCGCKHPSKNTGSKNRLWKGYEDISGEFYGLIKHNAKRCNLEFNLTIEYLWELYQKQQGKCAVSNILIDKDSWSLDRIDSTKGYTKGNVWWIHKEINMMKSDFPIDIFNEWCCKIYLNLVHMNL